MNRSLHFAIAAVAVVLASCSFGSEIHESFHQTVAAGGAPVIRVKNTVGDIRILGWMNPTVTVDATKSASSEAALHDTAIEVHHEGNTVTVETKYRGPVAHGGVSYRIAVPAGASLDVDNTTGAVQIAGVRGDVTATTQTGEIGAHLGKVDGRRSIQLTATTGAVNPFIATGSNATVDARSTVGSVSSDFPSVALSSEHVVGSSAGGTIGNGSGKIVLSTTTGAVSLRQQEAAAGRIYSPR